MQRRRPASPSVLGACVLSSSLRAAPSCSSIPPFLFHSLAPLDLRSVSLYRPTRPPSPSQRLSLSLSLSSAGPLPCVLVARCTYPLARSQRLCVSVPPRLHPLASLPRSTRSVLLPRRSHPLAPRPSTPRALAVSPFPFCSVPPAPPLVRPRSLARSVLPFRPRSRGWNERRNEEAERARRVNRQGRALAPTPMWLLPIDFVRVRGRRSNTCYRRRMEPSQLRGTGRTRTGDRRGTNMDANPEEGEKAARAIERVPVGRRGRRSRRGEDLTAERRGAPGAG